MNEKETLGKNLKRHRQFKGLTQEELGKKVGLTKDTISKLETAKQENIGLKYLTSICKELDIGTEELFIKDPTFMTFKLVASDENIKVLSKIWFEIKKILEQS